MALIIADHGMNSLRGHAASLASCILNTCPQDEFPFRLFGQRNGPLDSLQGLPIEPILLGDTFDRAHDTPHQRLAAFEQSGELLCQTLQRADLSSQDLVIFPTATPAILAGVAAYLSQTIDPAYFALLAMMPCGLQGSLSGEETKTTDPIGYLLLQLAWSRLHKYRDHCQVFTSNAQHAIDYMAATNSVVPYLEIPLCAPATAEIKNKAIALFLGDARPEKGFDLIPAIAALLIEALPDWSLTVQVTHDPADQISIGLISQLVELSKKHPKFTVLEGYLPRQAFEQHLSSHQIVLLGYDPETYANQSSGLLLEALAAGSLTVVPSNSWLSQELDRRQAPATTFSVLSAESISDALIKTANSSADLLVLAQEKAQAYQASLQHRPLTEEVLSWWHQDRLPGWLPPCGPVVAPESTIVASETAFAGWYGLDGAVLWAKEPSALLAFQVEPESPVLLNLTLVIAETEFAEQPIRIHISGELLFDEVLSVGSHQLQLRTDNHQKGALWVEFSGYHLSPPLSGDTRKLAFGLHPDLQLSKADKEPHRLGTVDFSYDPLLQGWFEFAGEVLWAKQSPASLTLMFSEPPSADEQSLLLDVVVAQTEFDQQSVTIYHRDEIIFEGELEVGNHRLRLPLPKRCPRKLLLTFADFTPAHPTNGDQRALSIGLMSAALSVNVSPT